MEEIKEAIQCNVCDNVNNIDTHYCEKCGRNLTDKMELTDVLFGISALLKWMSVIIIVLGIAVFWFYTFFSVILSTFIKLKNGLFAFEFLRYVSLPGVIMLIISKLLKILSLKLCKKNLTLE